MDDCKSSEIPTKSKPDERIDNVFFNWTIFRRRLLSKRILKYMAFYLFVYIASRKKFDPLYAKNYRPKVAISQPLSGMDTDIQLIENVIGLDSHKPSSNMALLMNQFAHCYLLLFKTKPWKKYAFNTMKEREDSFDPKYNNKDIENHILDVHISIWSFLMVVDSLHIFKKGTMNTSDKVMIFHHLIGLITCGIFKYHNNCGSHWSWVAFWSEGIGTLVMLGSMIRVFYQKMRPDLVSLRNISDVLFAAHMLLFTYARMYLFTKFDQNKYWYNVAVKDKYNQYSMLTRGWNLFICSISILNVYWVLQMWRVIGQKAIESISK